MLTSCHQVSPRAAPWASLAGGLGAVLVPKCPLCFAAYGSALGALGLGPAAHRWLVEPLLAAAVVVSFALVATLALRRRQTATFLISAAGAALALVGRFALDQPAVTALGALLLVGAALANSARCGAATRPNR